MTTVLQCRPSIPTFIQLFTMPGWCRLHAARPSALHMPFSHIRSLVAESIAFAFPLSVRRRPTCGFAFRSKHRRQRKQAHNPANKKKGVFLLNQANKACVNKLLGLPPPTHTHNSFLSQPSFPNKPQRPLEKRKENERLEQGQARL